MDLEEKIREIEEEIRRTPYNKATQHHIGKLKAKLAKLKEELETRKSKRKSREGFAIKKMGDATVIFVGFPSVGKSTLINKLTNVESKVGEYDFTTLVVIPGMLEYKGAKIQLLDLPGLIEGAASGRGRGREIISVARSADLIILMVDVFTYENIEIIKKELYKMGIRLNEEKPKVKIKKKDRGGIKISSTVKLTKIDERTIKGILAEYKIHNAEVLIREDITIDRFIDALAKNRVYIPSITVVNKIDLLTEEKKFDDALLISARKETNLDKLKDEIFEKLGFIRVYLKPQGGKPDLNEPMILKKGSTIENICRKLHKDFIRKFKYAKVWGSSVKFPGQRVGLEHKVEDGDIVTIVKEK